MNEKEALLQQLSDIQVPEPVALWPLTPGWWILFFLAAFALGFTIFALIRHLQLTRYRKQALRILKQIDNEKDQVSRVQSLEAIHSLLKRTALTAYKHSRNDIANLYGHTFFVFLESTLHDSAISSPAIKIDPKWHNALYRPDLVNQDSFPLTRFLEFSRLWINKHANLNAGQLQQRLQSSGLSTSPSRILTSQGLEADHG